MTRTKNRFVSLNIYIFTIAFFKSMFFFFTHTHTYLSSNLNLYSFIYFFKLIFYIFCIYIYVTFIFIFIKVIFNIFNLLKSFHMIYNSINYRSSIMKENERSS